MKKILVNISLAMLAVGGMTSCSDILDKEVDLTYTDENIYSNYDRTRGVLANAYTYLPDAFAGYTDGQFRAASRDCMTDNAISYWNVHYYHSVLNDSYDAKNHWFAENYWSNDIFTNKSFFIILFDKTDAKVVETDICTKICARCLLYGIGI